MRIQIIFWSIFVMYKSERTMNKIKATNIKSYFQNNAQLTIPEAVQAY